MSEQVGPGFSLETLRSTQKRSWEMLHKIAAQIAPGMTEAQGLQITKELFELSGVEKNWHTHKIRFGKNTTKGFSQPSEPGVVLQEDDIFFVDVGPVFDGHEGDVGKTFQLGTRGDFVKIRECGESLWHEVREQWHRQRPSGVDLYAWASRRAQELGYTLQLYGASGHRIGDFPHAVHHKGSLKSYQESPGAHYWILEIQLISPDGSFGAFYEDILS